MAHYQVNERAVERARRLIDARQYVLDSQWGDVQPRAEAENAFLERHTFDDYAEWHLGLTEGATDGTKGRYAFVYGDFRRLHRSGLIACHYRAAEWRHKEVELAAHELLQHLDRVSAMSYGTRNGALSPPLVRTMMLVPWFGHCAMWIDPHVSDRIDAAGSATPLTSTCVSPQAKPEPLIV